MNGEINDYMSASIVAQLLWLESDTPDKQITMYINSPGGSVTSGTRDAEGGTHTETKGAFMKRTRTN